MSHYQQSNQPSATVDHWNRGTTIVARPVSGQPGKEQLIAVHSPRRVQVGAAAGAGAAGRGGQQGEHALATRGTVPSRAVTERPQHEKSLSSSFASMIGFDDSHTFYWIPSEALCQYGLCETIHRRTSENTNYVLVHSREPQELSQNFTFPNGHTIDLNQDIFRISKVAQTVKNLDHMIGDGATGAQVKEGVRGHLPDLTKNSFYLVHYRDYSPWAVKTHYKHSRKDGSFGKAYVIRHFAIRVGSGPGCFIPLSEAQCLFGWEKLVEAHLESPEGAHGKPVTRTLPDGTVVTIPPRLALTGSEFDAMMGLTGPTFYGDDEVRRQQRGVEDDRNTNKVAGNYPSAWDWTPGAIQQRWDTFVQNQYQKLGRAVFKLILIAAALAFTYYALRRARGGGGQPAPQQQQQQQGGRRLGRQIRHQQTNGNGGYNQTDDVPGSLFEAVFSMNPKTVLDYALAPRGY